jgi:hypothetical protein
MLLCILFVSVQYATAADRRREELEKEEAKVKVQQELAFYQKQLEEVRVNRWQDKRNAVSKKEVFQEAWNELRRDVDKLALTKTQKEESMMRLQNQVEIREREVEELRLRRREFGIQVTEKLAEYEREIRSAFPVKRDALREEATTLKVFVEKNGYRPGKIFLEAHLLCMTNNFRWGNLENWCALGSR